MDGAGGSNSRDGSSGVRPDRTNSTICRRNSGGQALRKRGIGHSRHDFKGVHGTGSTPRLTVVKRIRKKAVATLATRDFAAGSNVVTDGLSCWAAVSEAICDHFPMVTGSGPNAAKWVPLTWVNTALGTIKTALAGTCHHVSAKHAQRCPTSFAWRVNRRCQRDTLTERLAYACARTAPHPCRVIVAG